MYGINYKSQTIWPSLLQVEVSIFASAKWQKQTDGDECRQILRASASAENERTVTVSGLEIQN